MTRLDIPERPLLFIPLAPGLISSAFLQLAFPRIHSCTHPSIDFFPIIRGNAEYRSVEPLDKDQGTLKTARGFNPARARQGEFGCGSDSPSREGAEGGLFLLAFQKGGCIHRSGESSAVHSTDDLIT